MQSIIATGVIAQYDPGNPYLNQSNPTATYLSPMNLKYPAAMLLLHRRTSPSWHKLPVLKQLCLIHLDRETSHDNLFIFAIRSYRQLKCVSDDFNLRLLTTGYLEAVSVTHHIS
jgi:hypothetical protein